MSEEKPKQTTDSIRERELYKAVFSNPNGQELIRLWEKKLTRVKSFEPTMSEAQCRYTSGRHALMIDIIKANKET